MGYGGTRIEDIAAEAGASRTAPYHYFTSKRDIFIAVGREATVAFRRVLDTVRAVPTDWTRDDLAKMIDAHLAFLDVHGAVISTWTQATWDDPELRDIGLGVQLHYFEAFGRELARLRGDAAVDPTHEAIAFQGMTERLWFFARNGGAGVIHDDELRHTLLHEAEAILTRRKNRR